MRAICIQQPWAALIADGKKTLEVRSWSTKYRGPVVVLASRAWSRHDAASRWHDAYFAAPRGVALCLVELVDVREGTSADTARTGGVDPTGYLVWQLGDPRPVEHLPVKGQLGLFQPKFHITLAT